MLDRFKDRRKVPFYIARYVKELSLEVWAIYMGAKDRDISELYITWIPQTPNIHTLTLTIYMPHMKKWNALAHAIASLQQLRHLNIVNCAKILPITERGFNFISLLLAVVGPRLHTLSLDLHSPLTEMCVEDLMECTSSLHHLTMYGSIGHRIRDTFYSSTIWGCAESLTSLQVIQCTGINAIYFAKMVIIGTWRNLEHLGVIECDGQNGLEAEGVWPEDVQWRLSRPTLRSFVLIGAETWELSAFTRIRSQEFYVKGVDSRFLASMLTSEGHCTGLERLSVHSGILAGELVSGELFAVCGQQGIEFEITDVDHRPSRAFSVLAKLLNRW